MKWKCTPKNLKAVQNQIVDFYAKCTNIQKDGIMPLLRNETFFTEKQLFDPWIH